MEMSPYVLSSSLSDGIVYYNTKNNHSFFISNALLNQINCDEITKNQYYDYLKSFNYNQEENELEDTLRKIKDVDEKLLEFTILTHGDCNFRCKYCYEKFENTSMSPEIEEAIVKFAERLMIEGHYERFGVQWFGGEPLLGYKTIIRLTKKFLELCVRYNIEYTSGITSNGYLLTQRKFINLVKNCRIHNFQITIDGEQEFHDHQRLLKYGGGSYQRILDNLNLMQQTEINFNCILRFNISLDNFESIEAFLKKDGLTFKSDNRFKLYFHNVGSWGQGDRKADYCVKIPDKDLSFYLSKKAIEEGYQLSSLESFLNNTFTCYANRLNHYMFNVRGVIQECTVALYSPSNIFGNVLHGTLNDKKRNNWVKGIEYDKCKNCPFILLCKSGYCPLVRQMRDETWERLCSLNKKRIQKDLFLFANSKLYNDILDIN